MDFGKLYQHINPKEIKEHFKWKAALCQHPMYMLIDEDRGVPEVGERVPPWGAVNADEYVKRVERNLESLDAYEDVKINYEFSGYEIKRMCEAYPEVHEKIKKALKKGKLGFVNGNYSQPHLHILSSESNWRQFELGLKTYRDLFDVDVKLYITQETALHKQISQLLKCFGIDLIALPCFTATIEVIEGSLEFNVDQFKGFCPVQKDDFVLAQSLDGTTLPLYIGNSDMMHDHKIYYGLENDLCSYPKLWVHFPDMIEVDECFHKRVTDTHEFVIMEDELRNMLKGTYPKTKVWLHTYWSYVEGVWAEELLRSLRDAEAAAVAAEALMCMNRIRTGQKADEILIEKWWELLLRYQHHDVYWNEVTDLRRRAIDANVSVKKECEDKICEISKTFVEENDGYISVLNWMPVERSVELITKQNVPGMATKRNITEIVTQEYNGDVFGFCNLPPCGFKSLELSGEGASPSVQSEMPKLIQFGSYEGTVDKTGLIKRINNPVGGGIKAPLDNETLIGEIQCSIGGERYDNRAGEVAFFDGPVASLISRKSTLKDIGLAETYYFYKDEGYIKAEIEFNFNGNEIGKFWIDNSKINILVPTSGDEVYHDIPFGYVEAKAARPLFAINWLHSGGLVFVNGGNVKHSVQNGVINNLIAWGGDSFDNRMHIEWIYSAGKYDMRLYGKHKIIYYIIPVDHFDGTAVSQKVSAITTPVYMADGRCDESGSSVLKDETVSNLEKRNIAVTSIYSKEDNIYFRGVKLPEEVGETISVSDYADFTIINEKII